MARQSDDPPHQLDQPDPPESLVLLPMNSNPGARIAYESALDPSAEGCGTVSTVGKLFAPGGF